MTRLRVLALLLVLPGALLGPILLSGEHFLPWMPVGLQPLAAEHPDAAAAVFEGANLVQGDRVFPVLTDQIAMAEELRRGRLPTWEPLFGLGVPLFAGSIAAAAYPPNWLGFVVPPEEAAAPLALLSLFLAGLGLWLFLGRLGLSLHARLFGVAAFQLGGWGVGNLYYYMKVDAALWLPWSLWAVEGLLARRRWSGLWLTASIAAALVAGFVTIAIFSLAFCGLYGLVRILVRRPWLDPRFRAGAAPAGGRARLSAALVVFLALGVAGSSVQLLPAFEASRESSRIARTVGDLVDESLPAATVLGTIVPELFGSPTEGTAPGHLPVAWWLTPADQHIRAETANQLEWNAYAGIFCVLLALVGVCASPRRALLPLGGLILVLGFAQAWWPLRWLFALPGLNIGAPARVLSIAWFLWPWLAAIGAQALLTRAPRALESLLAASLLLTAAAFLVWTGFEPQRWARSLETTLLERYGESHGQTLADIRQRVPPESAREAGVRLQRSTAHVFGASLAAFVAAVATLLLNRPRRRFAARPPPLAFVAVVGLVAVLMLAPLEPDASREPSLAMALFATLVFCGAAWTRRRRNEPGLALPLLAGLVLEGMLAAGGHVTGRPPTGLDVFPPSEAIEAVAAAAGDGRVLRFDPTPSGVAHVVNLARPNMLQPYGIADVTPYTVFTPRALNELFAALDPRTRYNSGVSSLRDASHLGHPLLDLLRVRAIVARDPLEHPRLRPVLERPGFHVYRREGALPAARVVPRAVLAPTEESALATVMSGAVDPFEATVLLTDAAPGPVGDPSDFEPGTIAALERPSRDRFDVRVTGSSGGWLVMHEQYYPGWHATVNGEAAEIVRADYAYRAVPIPAGDVVVETRYAPRSVFWGFAGTFLGLLVASFLSRGRG